ncbi:TldE protein, part of TldE/TldD proteolytic complex [Candidatus Syntrophocurvum alkaliphilum]|uniref:TldE protein, part of TldE/TldD proteolytic complex n=1 Tax=Candidatus Syntrophocurvum alkaliphilum TaxID=2293317 RepID=A0A6I6DBX2_9FIRM|nr:TldD/PmbA family protein [Candidatus Syntrophocurvum alkaliphilum]QGT98944.1 TldE protein, part of TldE/TldD proteolytic complex [Candidatus Syntrophocurvum alkaliphilum]
MEKYLLNTGEKALDLSKKKGVDAEVFLLYDKELSIEVSGGKVETLKEAEEIGMGLRVINNGRVGFSFTSDLTDYAIKEAVENAITISAFSAADENNILPKGSFSYEAMDTFDSNIAKVSLEDKVSMSKEIEEVARSQDKRISLVERSGYEDTEFISVVMNTNGLVAAGNGNFSGLYIFLVAEENDSAENGFSVMVKSKINDLEPKKVGEEAAKNALRSLNAKSMKSAKLPCILDPYVATKFMGVLAHSVLADSVQKGKSMFIGKEGEQIGSKVLNIVDDATFKDGIATFPFDSEGVPSQNNVLIENGILKGFLYDTYTANKAGVTSTGNGQRGSFRTLPSVGTSNFMISPGEASPENLIGDIEKGLYITEVLGMHTANPISGDYSVGAAGILIENGKLTIPVRGITIAGNLIDFLQDIDSVGNDLRFFGSKAASTIRLKSISVGGE